MEDPEKSKREILKDLQIIGERLIGISNAGVARLEIHELLGKIGAGVVSCFAALKRKTSDCEKARRAFKESERRYAALFEQIPIGLALAAHDGRVVDCNTKMVEMMGYGSGEEFKAINLDSIFCDPHERTGILRRLRDQCFPREIKVKFRRKDLSTFFAAATFTPFTSDREDTTLLSVNEISNRKQTEEAIGRSERELRILSSQLLTAHEEERKRIALELHDGIGQTLSAIKVRVELAAKEMGSGSYSKCTRSLSTVVSTIQGAIEEIRRISANLRPLILDELGILATISWLCREVETVHEGLHIERVIEIEEEKIPESLKTVIYRVSREALNNIAKHSRANLVRLTLKGVDNRIELVIDDNGLGFDPKSVVSDVDPDKGLGLSSMKERTELSGGSFEVDSRAGEGTMVRALWPLPRPAASGESREKTRSATDRFPASDF